MDSLLNRKIARERARAAVAQERLSEVVKSEILKCKHPDIGESDYEQSHRICLCCGLSEIGFSFINLRHEAHPRKVRWHEILALRTAHLLTSDDKYAFQEDPAAWVADPANERWFK
jgi:hypothetical protein